MPALPLLILALAPIGPLVLWLLWRGQTLSVALLRSRLVRLVTRRDTRIVYSVVSWFGTFLHEVSHASVLLLSGHGLREFRAGTETGHVLPARLRDGPVGFLSFLAAALAPLWVPAGALLVGLALTHPGTLHWHPAPAAPQPTLDLLRATLLDFPIALLAAIAHLDLARWPHALLLALLLLASPAARPSHVKGSRWHGRADEGDVAVLRSRIRAHPLTFLLFLAVVLAAYLLVLVWPPAYWFPMQALWMVAVTGIVASLFGAAWWSVAALATRTAAAVAWLAPAGFVAAQVASRLLRPGIAPWQANALAAAAWIVLAVALRMALPRR